MKGIILCFLRIFPKQYVTRQIIMLSLRVSGWRIFRTVLMKIRDDIYLYLPESFEWLILQSGLITRENLPDMLAKPYDYIDSEKYFSWERFFTEVLQDSTKGTVYQYVKNKLNPVFLHQTSKMKLLIVMKPLAEILGW